jgi:hypothetical protein
MSLGRSPQVLESGDFTANFNEPWKKCAWPGESGLVLGGQGPAIGPQEEIKP